MRCQIQPPGNRPTAVAPEAALDRCSSLRRTRRTRGGSPGGSLRTGCRTRSASRRQAAARRPKALDPVDSCSRTPYQSPSVASCLEDDLPGTLERLPKHVGVEDLEGGHASGSHSFLCPELVLERCSLNRPRRAPPPRRRRGPSGASGQFQQRRKRECGEQDQEDGQRDHPERVHPVGVVCPGETLIFGSPSAGNPERPI